VTNIHVADGVTIAVN